MITREQLKDMLLNFHNKLTKEAAVPLWLAFGSTKNIKEACRLLDEDPKALGVHPAFASEKVELVYGESLLSEPVTTAG